MDKMTSEVEALTKSKCCLERALAEIENLLYIAQECLYYREKRYGIDQCHDDVENSLILVSKLTRLYMVIVFSPGVRQLYIVFIWVMSFIAVQFYDNLCSNFIFYTSSFFGLSVTFYCTVCSLRRDISIVLKHSNSFFEKMGFN